MSSHTKHGYAPKHQRRKAEYVAWINIRQRCHNPRHPSYANYGARGIAVCDRWKSSFENFLADMGTKPSPRYTIERIDNNLGYSPDNCRWATRHEQTRNRRANNILTLDGETMCLKDWSKKLGITSDAITSRLERGWTVEESLSSDKKDIRRILRCNGQSKGISEWSRETGIGESTIRQRLKNGWSIEDALTKPPRQPKRSH